jgi:anti-sigma regulatory factor (Ser/Thr protein kinase)
VVHGSGSSVFAGCALTDGKVGITVSNAGRPDGPRPRQQHIDEQISESGRGLLLVEAYSDSWGVSEAPGHTINVWFQVRWR